MATLQKKDKEERRAVSHNPQTALSDRTGAIPNAPWIPLPQHARAASAQIPKHNLLAPLVPPAEIHRRPVGGSQLSISATSSPVSRPPTGYSSQPSSPYQTRAPHHAHDLSVPSTNSPTSAENSPTSKVNKRRSWFGSGGAKLAKSGKGAKEEKPVPAWIIGQDQRTPYDLQPLLTAQPVPELWDEHGNTFVYLFPRTSGHGPSFRVHSSMFSASTFLTEQAFGRMYSNPGGGMSTASLSQAHQRQMSTDYGSSRSRGTSPAPAYRSVSDANSHFSDDSLEAPNLGENNAGLVHLHLPIALSAEGGVTSSANRAPMLTESDVDTLISARNLFAFLKGQSIIGTERRQSVFDIFMKISEFLYIYKFSNLDGSSYGEIAHGSFEAYVAELRIADVRGSREKTIEAILLGEKMRSVSLYNEAFVHGVGRWDDLLAMQSSKFRMISNTTKVRMERAALDLQQRRRNIQQKLNEFDFPGMFSGIMNSKTADESRTVRFGVWRESFQDMRKWFMGYYRSKYGAWPPKASSKKNNLETSGLNRLVLLDLYQDLSDLYDLLVDRTLLTTRTTDSAVDDDDTEDATGPLHRALRKVLSEYDRSTPPVQPPIPFDVPISPMLPFTGDKKADTKATMKKLKKEALFNVLRDSQNPDAFAKKTPFLDAFKEFEFSSAAHCTINLIADKRQGQWLFLYAVLQSLPMLVVDAPAVMWTQGVEYFLCMPPRSGVPWARAESERTYYAIAGSNNAVVSLPSDIIQFGIEGIYRRSHCWQMAQQWSASHPLMAAAVDETLRGSSMEQQTMPAPGTTLAQMAAPRSRSNSPARHGGDPLKRRSVMLSNLEELPMPPGVFADPINPGVRTPSSAGSPVLAPAGSPKLRPATSQANKDATFDAILGTIDQPKKGKKK